MAAPKRGNYYNIWEKYGCRTRTVIDFASSGEYTRTAIKKVSRTEQAVCPADLFKKLCIAGCSKMGSGSCNRG
jgi:hypothetical protein